MPATAVIGTALPIHQAVHSMMSRLSFHINVGNLWNLPRSSAVPRAAGDINYVAVKEAGFDGLQHYFPEPKALDAGLEMSGMAKITSPEEARSVAEQHKSWGFVASTWHVGTGFETDTEMDALAASVLEAEAATALPVHIETQRATMTQDMRRTLDLLTRHPELTLNADFSHWYTGAEMPYGDFDFKLNQLAPVFARVRYMHGRIGHSSAMQLPLELARSHPCWNHHLSFWRRCFNAANDCGEDLIFAPELLPSTLDFEGDTHFLNYALLVQDEEQSDRWDEAIQLRGIVEDEWEKASGRDCS